MKYDFLLWDVDGTVLSFEAAETAGIKKVWKEFGWGDLSDADIKRYSAINAGYWRRLENNEITKNEVLVCRYRDFLKLMGKPPELAESFNDRYQYELGETIVFCDNSRELLASLKGKCVLAAITNGTKEAQDKKLSRSGLDRIFDYIFISDVMGIEKPNKGFFDIAFDKMGVTDPKRALVIGDSPTSDIRGGMNAGTDTCLYAPKPIKCPEGISPTYTISNLNDIMGILLPGGESE